MDRLLRFGGRRRKGRVPGVFSSIFLFRFLLLLLICLTFYYLLRKQRQHFTDLEAVFDQTKRVL